MASEHHSRLTTETKSALKTTEFALTVVVIVAILIASAVISGGDTGGAGAQGQGGAEDEFIARHAWLYVAIVTGAYSIGRGLAKSGSREFYDASTGGGGGIGGRVGAATAAFRDEPGSSGR